MIEIEKPRIERVEASDSYGKFVVEPLEHGFGQTLGNSLRPCAAQLSARALPYPASALRASSTSFPPFPV